MKNTLLSIVAVIFFSLPNLTAQEISKMKKPQIFQTLPKEYIEHQELQQQKRLAENSEDWWQPGTVYYNPNQENEQRALYQYNELGDKTLIAHQRINDLNEWIDTQQRIYKYHEDDNLKSDHLMKYDTIYKIWKDVEKYDVSGKKRHVSRVTCHENPTTVDISHLPSGIYIVKITTEAGVTTKKVVKK